MSGEGAVSRSRNIPMSLPTFQFELKRRWKILKEEQAALAKAQAIFEGKNAIWPDQCKNILALLYKIEDPVEELCALLENPASLPASVVQQRHLLLMAVQHTDEQNQALIEHITTFRELCESSSKQTVKLREEIVQGLYVFMREYDEVVNNIPSLLDQTRFAEKKLMEPELPTGELSCKYDLHEQHAHISGEPGSKEKAQEYLEETLRLVGRLEDRARKGQALYDVAAITSAAARTHDEALDCLQKVLVIVKEAGDDQLEEQVLDAIIIFCNRLKRLVEAKLRIEEALVLVQEIAEHLQHGRKALAQVCLAGLTTVL